MAVTVGIVGFAAFAWRPEIPTGHAPVPNSFSPALIEQGTRLSAAGFCASCHTIAGGKPFGGGYAMKSGFGTIYSTNISPDRETGIGGWAEEAFSRALRDGVARDGSHLFPALPYDHFTKLSDQDIHALYALIMTRAPVTEANRNGACRGCRLASLTVFPGNMQKGTNGVSYDPFSISGADHWYDVGALRVRAVNNDLAQKSFRPGWLRAVAPGWTNWALESFIDEAAHSQGVDPVAFRLAHLSAAGRNAGAPLSAVGGASRQANVNSAESPVGLGEPPTTVVAPAIGNAIYAAVGVRMRHLPIRSAAVKAAL